MELRKILFGDQLPYTDLWDHISDCVYGLNVNDTDKLSISAIEKLESKIDYLFDQEEDDD